jgi:predicted DNA-binding transcriptional regulator AlpA
MSESAYSSTRVVLEPIGVSSKDAAEALGISETMFLEMSRDGRMPKEIKIGRRSVWNLNKIRKAFEALEMKKSDEEEEWAA